MGNSKKRLQITLTAMQFKNLEQFSSEKGIAKSAVLALALEEYLKKQEIQKG